MTTLPAALHQHLAAPSLAEMWQLVRSRLERNGQQAGGTLVVVLDADGADRLAGLLGHSLAAGSVRLRLAEVDSALRRSAAARGLVSVTADLTGAPLADRRADRAQREEAWRDVWQQLDDDVVAAGLARHSWTTQWLRWLRTSGVAARLGPSDAAPRLRAAVAVLAEIEDGFDAESAPPTRPIGELAGHATGSAHGLDDGRSVAAFVLRAASFALEVEPPQSSAARRELWRRLGVETDLISGTVIVWGLRPSGADAWSRMMHARADLGLVTHLTARELRDVHVTSGATTVHACENPQVLQTLADADCATPLLCVSGNPNAAALQLVSSLRVRYHGDFDWPGIAITTRLLAAGAEPWRMSAADYLDALGAVPADAHLPLVGKPQPTLWDDALAVAMQTRGIAVHEETLIQTLLADLQ